MRLPAATGILALASVALAHAGAAAAQTMAEGLPPQVRVSARILVVDRDAITRAGLSYLILDNGRVRVSSTRPSGRGTGVEVGTHGVRAFVEAARQARWIRSESTQQVLVLSGREAMISSTDLAVGRRAARTRGPILAVVPTVVSDGTVHLRLSTRLADEVQYAWGYGVDGSPAAVDTEILATDGEELVLASSSGVQSSREAGLLQWGTAERGRDVLVVVSADVMDR